MADERNIIDENIDVRNQREDIAEEVADETNDVHSYSEMSAAGGRDYVEETSAEMANPARNDDLDDYPVGNRGYLEETSAEMAAPIDNRVVGEKGEVIEEENGRGWGYTGIALSIISLFILPVLFGAAGIVLGFVARRKGAEGLGATAIGIGAVAIIIGLFILPFV